MEKYDIAIIGCGMVGSLLALSLKELNLKIAIIDSKTPEELRNTQDLRATAFSHGNFNYIENLLEDLELKGAVIPEIIVEDGVLGPKITFSAQEISRNHYFGVNIPNQNFKAVVYEKLLSSY